MGPKDWVPGHEPVDPTLPKLYIRPPLGLKNTVPEQPDLAVAWRDTKVHLDQDPLGKTIFLYSTEGLLRFGSHSTRLGTGKSMPEGRAGDAEFLGKAP